MTFFKDLYRDLVEKRLWPLALGLVVALVAVPVVFSKSGGGTVEGPAPKPLLETGSAALRAETKPAVSLGSDQGFRKHIAHFPRKDPFVQQAKPKPPTTQALTTPPTAGGGSTSAPSGSAPSSSPTSGGGNQPVKTQPVKMFQRVATVKFGEVGKSKKSKVVHAGDFLPSQSEAVALSLGVSDDGKYALFMVLTGVTPRGDGQCAPSESDCQILRVKKGDVEFLEVARSADTVVTYELKLKSVALKELSKAKTARHNAFKALGRIVP